VPRDAEAWLAERGIERHPIRVDPAPPSPAEDGPDAAPTVVPDAAEDGAPPVSEREAQRSATQAAADSALAGAERDSQADPAQRRLEDDVAEAVAYIRRSTSAAPQAEGRVRDKLSERGWAAVVVEQALERARRERLVDDGAMAAALVEERRRRGHAPARIRRDLRGRGFTDEVLDPLLASAEAEDPEAAAYAIAKDKAGGLSGVPAETAFRRVASFVARRGYPDGLARKVAREAVFASRDQERAAGH
jgi:regulatory protein